MATQNYLTSFWSYKHKNLARHRRPIDVLVEVKDDSVCRISAHSYSVVIHSWEADGPGLIRVFLFTPLPYNEQPGGVACLQNDKEVVAKVYRAHSSSV